MSYKLHFNFNSLFYPLFNFTPSHCHSTICCYHSSFQISSLLAKAHIISCGEMMWYADPCVHFFCHWWLQAHHVCDRMTKSSNMWMFTKNCDSVLRLLDAAWLLSKARLSRLYFSGVTYIHWESSYKNVYDINNKYLIQYKWMDVYNWNSEYLYFVIKINYIF